MAESDDRDVSLLARDQYMREARAVEPLTEEEEALLFERLARAKHEPDNQWCQMLARHARNRLVEGYQWLVIGIATRAQRRYTRLEWADLVQEGNLGLLHAVDWCEQWNGKEGFVKYAAACIWGTLRAAWQATGRMVKLPARMHLESAKIARAAEALERKLGREPSAAQVAQEVGMPVHKVQLLRRALQSCDAVSIEALQAPYEDEALEFERLYEAFVSTENERHKQLEQAIREAIEHSLRPAEKAAARLMLEENIYRQEDMAAALGISYQAAHTRMYSAKKRLEVVLAPIYVQAQEALLA